MHSAFALAVLSAAIGGDGPRPRPIPTPIRGSIGGPMEVRIRYQPPIDKASEKTIIEDTLKKTIPYYEPAWLEDDAAPKGEPLGRVRIAAARVTREGQELVLATDPLPLRAVYVFDWLDTKVASAARDLYSGVETTWHYGAGDPPLRSGPLGFILRRDLAIRPTEPLDLAVRRNEESKYVLWTSLVIPKGKETLVLRGNLPFKANIGNRDLDGTQGKDGVHRVEMPLDSTGEPIEVTVAVTMLLDRAPWAFAAFWKRDGKEVPISMSQLALPWMPPEKPASAAPAPPFDLAGGDAAKGEVVFRSEEAKCAICHSVGGKGGNVGPALDKLKGRALAEVYHAIAEPSAAIEPGYRTYTIALKDGQVAAGVVRAEGYDSLRVTDINGKDVVVRKLEIEDMNASSASTMPVGLAGALGEAKMRDLLAFLTK